MQYPWWGSADNGCYGINEYVLWLVKFDYAINYKSLQLKP